MPEETFETPQTTPPVEQKSTDWTKIILAAFVGLGLLAGSAYAGYYYGTQQVSQPKADRPLDETPEPTPVPDLTTNWEKILSTRCGFEIQYPDGWYARETRLVSGTDNPELHYGCVDVLSPDYSFEDERIVGSALPKELYIKISRTKLGAKFKSVEINSLEDYIESDENIWEPPASVDYETSVFGGISGKEYIFGGFGTFHNFIFKQGSSIFRVSWPVGHEENYGNEETIGQILSTFKFLE